MPPGHGVGVTVLTKAQREMLEIAVSDHLGIPVAPRTLRDLVGLELYRQVGNFAGAFEYARWTVNLSLSRPGPDLLITLIEAVDGAALRYPELHQLVTDLRNNVVRWRPGAVDVLWMPSDWPFIDRDDIRALLIEMANAGGPPALAIEGGSGEGKRTMARFIEQLAIDTPTFKPIVTELRAETATARDLQMIAARLRVALALDADTDTTHAEPERHAQVLANELAQEAALAAGLPVWLVAVVPTGSGAENDVLRFVDHLLKWVHESPPVAGKLRVVLLTEQISLLGFTHPPPVEARLVLPQVSREHVATWLQSTTPGKTTALYDLSASLVLSEVAKRNPAAPDLLQVMAGQCIVAQRKLANAGVR